MVSGYGGAGVRGCGGAGSGQELDVQEQGQGAGTSCCVRRGGKAQRENKSLYIHNPPPPMPPILRGLAMLEGWVPRLAGLCPRAGIRLAMGYIQGSGWFGLAGWLDHVI